MLQTNNPESVNIGDEVQVIGRLVSGGFSPLFSVSSVQLLREKPPILPLSVTATEAASGAEAGSLVEVTGVVRGRTRNPDGGIVLEMADPAQSFSVSLKNSLFNSVVRDWSVGSTLRVRGICTVSPEATSGDSFTILVGSPSEISVISGPPWWSGWRLVRTIALSLLIIVIGVYVFFRLERSKHRAILQERERLAHTMHDTLAQSFAGVGYYLQSIRRSLRKAAHLPNEVLEELNIACALVTDTHRQASASIAALHPDTLAHQDLLKALVRSATTMLGGDPLPIALQREGHTRALPPAVVEALYQVGCEAISNVLRHAHANSLKLGVHYGSKYVTLSIEDDGVGFTQDAANDGFGLQGMRRRCQAIGAQLTIRTDPGSGCTVSIAAPYRWLGSISGLLRTHLWRQLL
jgi:two-component sensor histidine kinase